MNENLKSHFMNLYSMVMADGNTLPEEKTEMYRIGSEEFGVTAEQFDQAIFSDEVLFYIPQSDKEKITYLYDLGQIAWADGQITEEEQHLMKNYARRFGVVEDQIDTLIDLLLDKAKLHLSHDELMNDFCE